MSEPTTAAHAARLCAEALSTGLNDQDTELLRATVLHYDLDLAAGLLDWQRSFSTLADAEAIQAHFANRGRGKRG